MPGKDGVAVLREIREQGCTVPVLLLTAKTELADRVVGLDAGADDYLPKPFASTELLARVRAMLRRGSSYLPELLTFGNLTLSCSVFELSVHGKNMRLSNKEFQIMELFMRSPRALFSTEQLIPHTWGWNLDSEANVVWTNIISTAAADQMLVSIAGKEGDLPEYPGNIPTRCPGTIPSPRRHSMKRAIP